MPLILCQHPHLPQLPFGKLPNRLVRAFVPELYQIGLPQLDPFQMPDADVLQQVGGEPFNGFHFLKKRGENTVPFQTSTGSCVT